MTHFNPSLPDAPPAHSRHPKIAAIAALAFALAGPAAAATLNITPISFVSQPGYSVTAAGTVTTGATPGTISDWSIALTTVQQIARYTPANTIKMGSGITAGSGALSVASSPDGSADGGLLAFRSANPLLDFGTFLADFTGYNAPGGQAMYMAGGNFDFLWLNQPNATNLPVATLTAAPGVYALNPISFGSGVTLTGTITTDGSAGSLGLANILSWDILATQTTVDRFDSSNSALTAWNLGTAANGTDLAVTNPGGYLGLSKGALGGRPWQLVLADFTDPAAPGGTALYQQGRIQLLGTSLHAPRGQWAVTGGAPVVAPVPLPAAAPVLAGALALLAGLKRRRRAA